MKYLLIFLLINFTILEVHSQCSNDEKGFFDALFGIPKELNRGRLKLTDMRYGNPYTLVDRNKYPNPNDAYVAIRDHLINNPNSDLGSFYKKMHSVATIPQPPSRGYWQADNSKLAEWTKYNAFIFVIGLDTNFQYMDTIDPTGGLRNQFADRALEAFKYMETRVPNAPYDGLFDPVNRLQHRARELIMYCEAYDWLKAAAYDPMLTENRWPLEKGDADRNGNGKDDLGDCSPRNRLRLFARNFYTSAEGEIFGPIENFTGWKKNHGIMAASAIGMAAIVLNDAGVETSYLTGLFDWVRPAPAYSPRNWYKLGELCWENLSIGWHILGFENTPQTNGDGSSGGLVLDSGSVTHIGLNSTILIHTGGTLLIKRGATVIVGDSDCIQNRGELLADHGAYVCIEEGAVIKFYNDIDSFNFYYKDTLDRHLVYIAMPKGSGKPGERL